MASEDVDTVTPAGEALVAPAGERSPLQASERSPTPVSEKSIATTSKEGTVPAGEKTTMLAGEPFEDTAEPTAVSETSFNDLSSTEKTFGLSNDVLEGASQEEVLSESLPSVPETEAAPPIGDRLIFTKPLSPVPEEQAAPRTETPVSVNSSSSSLASADFSPSVVFQDLYQIEQRIESNYIYAAIEHAVDDKGFTYVQATDMRMKVALLVDMYGQKYRQQKNMQEMVMNQIDYYQQHYEEVYEAETMPWQMRQQLQGLRGDTQRLNDELTKSKIHLTQLEADITTLELDKLQLHDTLGALPTAREFRHLSTCLHLEQQVIMQQLENYRSLTVKTGDHIYDNNAVVAKMELRTDMIRTEVAARRKDLANLINSIPHIQKDCSLLSLGLGKLGEEMNMISNSNQRLYAQLQAVNEVNQELDKERQTVYDNRVTSEHELDEVVQSFKELIRKMDQACDADLSAKNDRTALVQSIQNADAALHAQSQRRLDCIRQRDRLSTNKQNLDMNNQRMVQANDNDEEAVDHMTRKATEQEQEAERCHLQFLKLELLINNYAVETQARKEDNTHLYRQQRERYKALFLTFIEIRKMAKEGRRIKDEIEHMELARRSVSIASEKFRRTIISLREELEHKDVIACFGANTLAEKMDKVDAMQADYYRLDRERQDMQEFYRVCQGGLHEHKDRLTFVDNELKRVKEDCVAVHRLLEKAQHDRRNMWISLTRVRKSHFSEREKLKELEDTFERGFSRVLVFRRDLDVNLLKCETFTETFDLVSELRVCEAALLIDITTQYMLKHVEKNQIATATYQTELRHRSLDSYVEWLHKTADTDIKLLYKRIKWHGSLLLKYTTTREELKDLLVATVNRRARLNELVKENKAKDLAPVIPIPSVEALIRKEETLSKMFITMEQRFFQQTIRHSLIDGICQEATKQIQTWRDALTTDHNTVMAKRERVVRAKRRHKLAMIDVAAIKTQLCNELVLSDNLQTVQQLTLDKYQLPQQLQAGDQRFQITDGSELKAKSRTT